MELTSEEAREIIFDCHEDWRPVSEEKIEHKSRWEIHYSRVFKYLLTNKFYMFFYSRGATEMQDTKPFEFEKTYTPTEVHEVQKIVKSWEPIDNSTN